MTKQVKSEQRLLVLGALGDLALRHLVPALAALEEAGALPRGLSVVGVDRRDVATDEYRALADRSLRERFPEMGSAARAALVSRFDYRCVDLDAEADLGPVLADGPVTAYLTLPAAVQSAAVEALVRGGLSSGSRVVVEKPYGEDLSSARALTALLHRAVPESDVFRVDHFLFHQGVHDLLALRLANPVLAPLWHRGHVSRIDVVWEEGSALAGRAEFYDRTGALRDMVQSHLLQVVALLAMEPPATWDAGALSEHKAAALRHVPSLDPARVPECTARGRYGPGRVDGLSTPGYADEHGVDAGRGTETYAHLQLNVESERWHGVPFVLRTGKALATPRRRVEVTFSGGPGEWGTGEASLAIDMLPDGIGLDLTVAAPDGFPALEPVTLTARRQPQPLPPTARMLRDVFSGDHTFFVSAEEVEECWRIVDPILAAWRTGTPPLQEYAAGTEGPRPPSGD